MAKDPYRYFRIEARELLDQLGKGVLTLEQDGAQSAPELVLHLLRWAHTLKGAARVVRQGEIANLIHGVEDLLAPLREGTAPLPRPHIDQVLNAFDQIELRLAALPQPAGAAPPEAAPGAALDGDAPQRIGRADVVEIDTLLEGLGEIGAELAAMRHAVASLGQERALAGTLASSGHGRAAPGEARLQQMHAGLERTLLAGLERVERELRQSRDAAERLRLAPVGAVFQMLARSVRDAAHSQAKQVVFEPAGGELRIDGAVLDLVQGALVQLVRNAVAHGIESPAERQAAGKHASGRIVLDVVRRGYRVWFRCSDDGRGVDLAALRRELARRGLAAGAAEDDDTAALLARLLRGGISTSASVTELAGRGIGLDVVRAAIDRLGGEVQVHTLPGAGTTIELGVPLSLAALDVLMVEADGQLLAMPLDAVRGAVRVTGGQAVRTADGAAVEFQGALLPLLPLNLHARTPPSHAWAQRALTAVVIGDAERRVALAVTRLRGIDCVVLRGLPGLAPADALVLGLYLDDEGNPRIVLDPEQLADTLAHRSLGQGQAPLRKPILIIDDSLTTRMLESSILESAGFDVALAASAEEALEMAERTDFALFLVDVEMPGMNGFAFVETTRADARLREVPAILVTSLDSPEDRRRGADAGACDYIVKSEFDQGAFLARIGELVP